MSMARTLVGIGGCLAIVSVDAATVHAEHASPASENAVAVFSEQFATAKACALCHSTASSASGLKDAKNRPIGPHDLWKTTMMAHSTAHPLWRAVVAAEVAATPSRKAEIEARCLKCHAPMASIEAQRTDVAATRETLLKGTTILRSMASDGVSWTLCHQLSPKELEADRRFGGEFAANDGHRIYGPHSRPFFMPMYRHTNYRATESSHVGKSALCAFCHTFFTHGRLRIEASLLYQSLGTRYAAELLVRDVPEMSSFAKAYGTADPQPDLLAHDVKIVDW